MVVDVDVPDVPPERLRGLCGARLPPFGAAQVDVTGTGEDFGTPTSSEVSDEPAPDTDVALLREGWATVTLLQAPSEVPGADLPGLDRA